MDKKTKMKEKKASGIWKKVLGICLAVIMVIGMTMPAWAQIDAESKGSIKVTADESGWTASAYRCALVGPLDKFSFVSFVQKPD